MEDDLQEKFRQIESNIADEISFIIRWRTSKIYFSGEENLGSGHFGRLKTDLQGAFEIASIILFATFFQEDGDNSLKSFVKLAHSLQKIDKSTFDSLIHRLDVLKNSNDCETLKNLRNKVFAHWDRNRPEHPDQPIDITPIIEEIISIFEGAQGRNIDRDSLEKDVKIGWQHFLKRLPTHVPSTSL